MDKLFVIRKFIKAKSIQEALKKDKTASVDEIWLDEDWRKEMNNRKESSTGFIEKSK